VKILHVLDHLLPLQSGYVYRTLGILRAQRSFGWQTVQLTGPRHNASGAEVETVDGWEFQRTRAPRFPGRGLPIVRELGEMAATAARLRSAIAAHRPDIVHAHSPLLNTLPATKVGREQRIPVVYEVRGLWEDAAVDLGHTTEGSLRYRTTRYLDTVALKRADGVVVICRGLQEEISGRGIRTDRMVVVPNAVDDIPPLAVDHAGGKRIRASLGIADRFVLGFVGSFYHYEGLRLLLEAVPDLVQAVPNIHVLLVGGGPEDAGLRQAAEQPAVKPFVTFTGRVPHAAVPDYYHAIDLFACPRLKMRLTDLVTPLKPLEAMAQGVPVLASDVGGHRELVAHERTGLLFRAGDRASLVGEVARAAGSQALCRKLAADAHRFVSAERTWSSCARPYKDLYERLLADRR